MEIAGGRQKSLFILYLLDNKSSVFLTFVRNMAYIENIIENVIWPSRKMSYIFTGLIFKDVFKETGT